MDFVKERNCMSKYLNEIAVKQVENHLIVQSEECRKAKEKAIKEGKIDSEIKMWFDMEVIYLCLKKHLDELKELGE